jgi:hypothetical protein
MMHVAGQRKSSMHAKAASHASGTAVPKQASCSIFSQVGDRMELLQMALEARPRAYAESGRLALLAELLGVAERHAEVPDLERLLPPVKAVMHLYCCHTALCPASAPSPFTCMYIPQETSAGFNPLGLWIHGLHSCMQVRERQAAAALAAGDTAAAAEHAVALAAEGFAPAWRVAAQVLHAPDSSDAWRTEPASMRALAAFVLTHCQPDQAREFLLPRASPSAVSNPCCPAARVAC